VLILILTGWWGYLWILFGGANQLMASMALMLMTAWLMSQGKPYGWTFYPMIFMFFTTAAALLVTSYRLFFLQVLGGKVKGGDIVGNTFMSLVAIFLVIAAIILAVEGIKAFSRYKVVRAEGAPAKA
jgi:carbon starvation protein